MDRHRDRQLVHVWRHVVERHLDGLVIALALAGQVVTGVLDRPVGGAQVVVEDEVLVAADPAAAVQHEEAGVEVEVLAIRRPGVPSQADQDVGEAGRLLRQRDVATLVQ